MNRKLASNSLEECIEIFRQMYLIRVFEFQLHRLVSDAGVFSRFITPSAGQEAVSVGVCAALRPRDRLALSYRSHAAFLARGADLGRLLAEILGRRAGYCGGRTVGIYTAVPSLGIIHTSPIVAGQIPVATGSALASWIDEDDSITVCFFGDGAVAEGAFHESLNIAALLSLPVVFVCENNGHAVRTSFRKHSPVDSIAQRASAYGINSADIDGNDPFQIREAAQEAIERARKGKGPFLIECRTQLLLGHNANIISPKSVEELRQAWCETDPVHKLRLELLGHKTIKLRAIEESIERQVDESGRFCS